MPAPTPKELKKLIKVCRESGVTKYSGDGFSFELSETGTFQSKKTDNKTAYSSQAEAFESDTLSDAELLMWSSAPGGVNIDEDSAQ